MRHGDRAPPRSIFNCTEACPREIHITRMIGEVKKATLKASARVEPIGHATAAHG